MLLTEQVRYTKERIWAFWRDCQRYRRGGRPAVREERLGTKPPPLESAPWEGTASERADMEGAFKRLPFDVGQAFFMAVAMGHSSWRTGNMHAWKERVAEWWDMEQGELNRVVEGAIESMYRDLNRTAQPPVY